MEQNIPVININPLKDKIIVHKYDHKCYIYQFDYQKASDSHVVYFKYDGVGHCEDSSCMIPLTDGNRLLLVDLLTQYVGTHNVELYEVDTEGQYVKSSEIFELVVKPVVNGGNVQEVHDPDLDLLYLEYKALYDRLVLKEEDLNDLITDIEYKRDHGQFDGFSPVVSTERVSDGVVINITDKNGTHVSKVNDGQEGSPGEPGFSPVATVTKNGRVSRLTVTDKNGTTSTDINDGTDGYTPRKGIDYFTQSDKNQIIDEVIDRVPPYDDTEIRQDISDLQEEDVYLRDKINEIELSKFPNVTIYGEPTIRQGQVSGFSTVNYLQFPFVVNFQNKKFEIDFEFTTGTDVSNQHNILDSDFGLAFAVRQNRFVIALSTTGTSWDVGEGVGTHVVNPNTTYKIRMTWDGSSEFKLEYSADGGTNYVTDIVKPLFSQPYPKQMLIGVSYDKMHNFNGIVNLNTARLTIADTLVWVGMGSVDSATRLAIDLSNIDEEGIVRMKELVEIDSKADKTDLAETVRKLDFLYKLNKGQTWDFEEVVNDAYTVDVPSGAKASDVLSIGGNSVVWNQIIPSRNSLTNNGITYTNNGNGYYTVKGVNTGATSSFMLINPVHVKKDHKYYANLNILNQNNAISLQYYGAVNYLITTKLIFSVTEEYQTDYFRLRVAANEESTTVGVDSLVRPMVVDLTQLFGQGNEPTSVDDARIKWIEEYAEMHPELNEGEIVSAEVDEIIIEGQGLNLLNHKQKEYLFANESFWNNNESVVAYYSNDKAMYIIKPDVNNTYLYRIVDINGVYVNAFQVNSTWVREVYTIGIRSGWTIIYSKNGYIEKDLPIETYPIPQAIKDLEGYGWGVNDVRNEVDFENAKNTQKIGSTELNSLNWSYNTSFFTVPLFFAPIPDYKYLGDLIQCSKYITKSSGSINNINNNELLIKGYNNYIYLRDDSITSVQGLKDNLVGSKCLYELAEPIVSDISESLEPFEVESGGSITFDNDAKLSSESKIKYVIKLDEV